MQWRFREFCCLGGVCQIDVGVKSKCLPGNLFGGELWHLEKLESLFFGAASVITYTTDSSLRNYVSDRPGVKKKLGGAVTHWI
jgi:hypothetical protein